MRGRLRIDWRIGVLASIAVVGALIVALVSPDRLIGAPDTDLSMQFLAWRAFAADSMHAGHLPLWNPYTYAGEPFLAGFQSAVLYPLNLIFLVLPLNRAVNFSYLIHLLILGAGVNRMARQRGLDRRASFLAGCLLPLSGPVYTHLYAGHLSNLCSMAWTPWILAAAEDWPRRGRRSALILAAAAIAVQILAGQVQYVFYTGIAAGLQAVVSSLVDPAVRRRALPGLAAAYAGGALLAAVQLFPGLAAASENWRHARLGFDFVSIFSFPIENLVTVFASGFFGDLRGHFYWGRDYLWEMSLFFGTSGLILGGFAAFDPIRRRSVRFDLALAGLLMLLAFGSQTPLLRVLYDYAPGFDRFRGLSKFSFPAVIYIVLAVAAGADAVMAGRLPRRGSMTAVVVAALVAVAAGAAIRADPALFASFLLRVKQSGQTYVSGAALTNPGIIRAAARQGGQSVIWAGICLGAAGAALLVGRRWPVWRWAVFPVFAVEMAVFARANIRSFSSRQAVPASLRAFVQAHPGDYRVLDALRVNNGYLLGVSDIWGNDPGLLRRYDEFMAYTQGIRPDDATQVITFHSIPPLFGLLRLRYVFQGGDDKVSWTEYGGALDRVQLVPQGRVLPNRDAILAAMSAKDFNARRTVLLESEPDPAPAGAPNPGIARVLEIAPDFLVIEAMVRQPALLLVSDGYSRDWRVRSLLDSDRHSYDVMPADYILRAVPLGPGYHLLRMEYEPSGFRAGVLVSLAACALLIFAAVRLRKIPAPAAAPPGASAAPA